MGEETKTWSECLELWRDLEKDVTGILDHVQKVKHLDFRDFCEISWESTDCSNHVNKVKKALRRLRDLTSLNLRDCELTGSQLRTLCSVFDNLKIKELHIGDNRNINDEGWRSIGSLVNQSGVKSVNAQNCELSTSRIVEFFQASDSAKISELDISENKTIDAKGWSSLGRSIVRCELDKFTAKNCGPTAESLLNFGKEIKGSKLSNLDLSCDKKVDIDALLEILPCIKERLVLRGYEYTDDELVKLRDKLKSDNLKSLTIQVDDSIGKRLDVTVAWEPCPLPPTPSSPPQEIASLGAAACPSETEQKMASVNKKMREDVDKGLVTTEEKTIGPGGGTVKRNGCIVKFKGDDLEPETKVTVTIDATSSDLPRGYCGASPEVEIRLTQPGVDVEVILPVYRIPDDDEYDIVHKKSREIKWNSLDDANPKRQGKVVKFFSRLLGHFKAVLPQRKMSEILLVQYLYYKPDTSSLFVPTCVADKSVKKSMENEANKCDYKLALVKPDKIFLRGNDELRYCIKCVHDEAYVRPQDEVVLTRETFTGITYCNSYFVVKPEDLSMPTLNIEYKLWTPKLGSRPPSVVPLNWNKKRKDLERPAPRFYEGDMTDSVPEVNVTRCTEAAELRNQLSNIDVYDMRKKLSKGVVLIINNEFKGKENERKGSEIDVRNLEALWEQMGFQVFPLKNLTSEQMRDACRDFAKCGQSGLVGMVVLIIMSHGGKKNGQEFFSGEDNELLYSEDVISYFTSDQSPHLEGIPKVFLFQACRGNEKETGMEGSKTNYDAAAVGGRSNRQDMLIAYPSQSGYAAFRHRDTGSWMMNAVTNVFMRHAYDTDVLAMMTKVNEAISKKKSPEGETQTSNQLSSLRKKLFLFPGYKDWKYFPDQFHDLIAAALSPSPWCDSDGE